MKNLFFLCITIVSLILSIKYQYGVIDFALLLLQFLFFFSYFKGIERYSNHLFVFFMLFYIFCSVHLVSLFELTSYGFFKNNISYEEYGKMASWGNELFFIISAVLFILKGREPLKLNQNTNLIQAGNSVFVERFTRNYIIFVYFLQVFSMSIGIVSNQQDATLVLPFHLNGVFDELRSSVCQYIICIYLFDRFNKHLKVSNSIIILYFIYAVIEIFLRNSKGALIISFIPVIVMMFMMGRINKKILIKYIIPLILFFSVSYTVIEVARIQGQISFTSLIDASRSVKSIEDDEKSSPYIRAFLTGVYYTKAIDYISSNKMEFDFKNAPIMIAMRGGPSYMTRVIDGMPEDVHHSSGVTGLCDALLFGGYPLCFLVMLLLAILAIIGDRYKLFQQKPLYRLIFFLWFYARFTGTTVSFFIDPMFLSIVGSIIIRVLLTKLYYKKDEQSKKNIRVLSYN